MNGLNNLKRNKMKKYNDCKFLAQSTVEDKKIILVQDLQTKKYFIYWGNTEHPSRTEITTPSGRKISESSAIKKFLEMVEASKYLKFDKL
jgi:hypothetical protein